jgi:hypothetical protein
MEDKIDFESGIIENEYEKKYFKPGTNVTYGKGYHGTLHRLDGPAYTEYRVKLDGTRYNIRRELYFIDGVHYSKEDFDKHPLVLQK